MGRRPTLVCLLLVLAVAVGYGVFLMVRAPTESIPQPVSPHMSDRAGLGPGRSTASLTSDTAAAPPAKRQPAARQADLNGLRVGELADIIRDRAFADVTRNNAANRLLNERDPKLAGELIRMLKDETESVTWRNYCVQFLRGCYEQKQEPVVLETLLETCRNPKPELSSCALWSLAQLAAPTAPTPPNAVGKADPKDACARSLLPLEATAKAKELALAALRDEKAHLLVRTGGAQSCAHMGLTEAAPELRKLAESPQTDISLRTVAIAGLGQLKDEDSRPLLTTLCEDQSARIRQAAQMALKRLDAAKAKTPATP